VFYREAGQYKTTYAADMAVFPLRQDRIGIAVILRDRLRGHPADRQDFFIASVMIPFLVFSLAAIGLNILTGYTGLISLGTAAFMGVGAYACYKLTTFFPGVNIIVLILLSGFCSRRPSACCSACRRCGSRASISRSRRSPRSSSCNGASCACPGCSTTTPRARSRCRSARCSASPITGAAATPETRYLRLLGLVVVLTWFASNLVHGRIGRSWMAVRDMDIAAELMGIKL
jgi:branched-chain amino acid transport system permease protein